jgi:hypothetical protein
MALCLFTSLAAEQLIVWSAGGIDPIVALGLGFGVGLAIVRRG